MNHQLQSLPSIDKLLKTQESTQLIKKFGHSAVVKSLRFHIEQQRSAILNQSVKTNLTENLPHLFQQVENHLSNLQQISMKTVFNLTGTILHTNLGRSLWSENAISAAINAMKNNVALEFNLDEGKRGHRDSYIAELLQLLVGAESACIVNNNAAAILLILSTLAQGKEVIISRGELIEIGGSFRIPDIMQQAHCKLVEVGTTNRTHLDDYRKAITENTAFLMKVHTSNYHIQGFTSTVSEEELIELGKEFNLPIVSDLGSGSLLDLKLLNLVGEPLIAQKLACGVDLISFSGDKLLGGPQAGIIVGKKELIEQIQNHPLKRVLRCDKVILSALEATLRHYLFPERLNETLPTIQLLTQPIELIQKKAEQLKEILIQRLDKTYSIQIEFSFAQIGSGALPSQQIPSVAVTIAANSPQNLFKVEKQLKQLSKPIIGRFYNKKLWLDMRSVVQFEQLIEMIKLEFK